MFAKSSEARFFANIFKNFWNYTRSNQILYERKKRTAKKYILLWMVFFAIICLVWSIRYIESPFPSPLLLYHVLQTIYKGRTWPAPRLMISLCSLLWSSAESYVYVKFIHLLNILNEIQFVYAIGTLYLHFYFLWFYKFYMAVLDIKNIKNLPRHLKRGNEQQIFAELTFSSRS